MILEKLVIPVGFDTGLLVSGLELIKSGIDAAVGVMEKAIDRTQEWAEHLDQLGDITGMSGDQLAAWSFIAEKAGVPVESLARGLVILEKGLVKADGSLDTMGKTLKDYGINIKTANGQVKNQSALMGEIARKYASFSTQQERVNFLTAVFGRSGADLVDVFDTLAQEGGIDAVTAKVQALGLVLDSDQFEGFKRTLNEIDLTFTGLANTLVGPLLPGAEALVNKFRDWLQSPWVINGIKAIGESLGTLINDINTGLTTGDWSKFWGDAQAIWDALKLKVEEAFNKGIAWLDANPIAITDFINRMMLAILTGAQTAEDDPLLQTINTFLKKLTDQVLKADWAAFDQALGQKLWDTVLGAMNRVWDAAVQWLKNLWDLITSPDPNFSGDPFRPGFGETPPGGGGGGGGGHSTKRAGGGFGSGLVLVGEGGAEFVNLPSGSFVNSSGDSQGMGFDYDRLAALLAVEVAKVIG